MVQTITPVVHGGRRSRWGAAVVLHAVGAGVSAAAFGAVLGTGGSFLGAPWDRAGDLLIAGVALLYAAREAFGLPVPIPDRRRQVPEWWRSTFSPNAAAILYGLGLGIGFLTYVRYGTLVAVSTVALAFGNPLAGALILAPFGVARGLSVGVVWTGISTERVQRVVDRLGSLAGGPAPTIANATLLFLLGLTALLLPLAGGSESAVAVTPWILALLFGWAGVAKLARFRGWEATLKAYALPRRLEILALPLVPLAEATVTVLALSGQTRQSAALAVTLLIMFSGAVLRARNRHGRNLPCGCFGKRNVRDYRALLLRNLALSIAAVTVLAEEPGRPLLDGLRAPHLHEALPAVLVLLGLALGVSAIAQVLRLGRSVNAAPRQGS